MKLIVRLFLFLFFVNVTMIFAQSKSQNFAKDKLEINTILDQLNEDAANANYTAYFDHFAPESTFIGTDMTEIWDKKAFQQYAKPHFDKKKTWNFTSLQRNIYFHSSGKMAWFDEVLDTQMKGCRGSGVLEKINGKWKIRQYVLSMTIPNLHTDAVIKEKSATEEQQMKELKK